MASVAKLAAGRWGVGTLRDLRGCGPSYAWVHQNITDEGRFLAAVVACGPSAVLSHYSAAALHALVRWDGRPFEITAPSKHRPPRINAHRSQYIERIVLKGIPVTPKLRTVIDLARVEGGRRQASV